MSYTIIEFPAPYLMLTSHSRYGQQLWSEADMTHKHINDECAICGLVVGSRAFRPAMSNAGNRMERICLRHITEQAVTE